MSCTLCNVKNVPLFRDTSSGVVYCGGLCQRVDYHLIEGSGKKRGRDGPPTTFHDYSRLPRDVKRLLMEYAPTLEELSRYCQKDRDSAQLCQDPNFLLRWAQGHTETLRQLFENVDWLFGNVPDHLVKWIIPAIQVGSLDPTVNRNSPIIWASKVGRLEIVKFLSGLRGVDPTTNDNLAIALASLSGHLEVVKFLSGLPGVDPTARTNQAIIWASEYGRLEIVKFLSGLPRVDPTARDNEAIYWASRNGHLEVVEFLKTLPGVYNPNERDGPPTTFHDYSRLPRHVKRLLMEYAPTLEELSRYCQKDRDSAQLCQDANFLLRWAQGHTETLRQLFETVDWIWPGVPDHLVKWIIPAIQVGSLDPTVNRNSPIIWTSEYGHLEVVKFLSGLPGVDPTAQNNMAIVLASEDGHLEVVKLLSGLPDVDPTAQNNEAIIWASNNGHLEVVKFLSGLPRVDASAQNNEAIIWASSTGHLEVVKFLSGLTRVDASAQNNEAIIRASRYGHLEVVKFLSGLPRVDASARNNEAIISASRNRYLEVVKFLKTLPGVYNPNE